MLKARPTQAGSAQRQGRLRAAPRPGERRWPIIACLPATSSGVFSPGIEACARLRSIDVRDNLLDDAVSMVAHLGALTRLERIDARHNPFSRHFTGGGNANPDPDPNPAPAPAPGTDTHRSLTVLLTLTLSRREPDLRSGRTARRRAVPGAAVLAGAPRLGPARPRRARWPARRRRGAGPRQPAAARLHAAAARARDAGRGWRHPAGGALEPGGGPAWCTTWCATSTGRAAVREPRRGAPACSALRLAPSLGWLRSRQGARESRDYLLPPPHASISRRSRHISRRSRPAISHPGGAQPLEC